MGAAGFLFEALRRVTPRSVRRRAPRRLKRWLRGRALGYTPYDFDGLAFDAVATPDDVAHCYRLLLGRLPDPEGWKTYEAAVRGGGMRVDALVADFLASPEFQRRALLPPPAPVLVDVGDFKLYVAPDDFDVGEALLARRGYEPHVAAALRRRLGPGAVFVDAGAHVGYFSLLAASIVGPAGRVVSIEPSQSACGLLWASVRLNGYRQVELYPFALAEARGIVRIAGSAGHGRLVDAALPIPPGPGSTLAVSVTLDELLAGAPRVDAIKLDIEGAEGRALRGAERTLAAHRPMLVTELAPAALQEVSGVSGEEYLRQIVALGYDLAVIEPDGRPASRGSDPAPILRALAGHPSPRIEVLAEAR